MSFDAGSIVIELNAKDGNYTATIKNAGELMRQFKLDLERTATSVKRLEEHQFSLGRRFRDLVITLGNLRFALMDINDAFIRLPASILKSAGEIEKTQALLAGLSKAVTKAGRDAEGAIDFAYITKTALAAPFSVDALAKSFVKLKSAGLDPADGSMRTLVDSVARFGGTSETLQRASTAIQQMVGKGVVSMEELRQQLGEAVPTAMRSMATGMSMSMAQLTATISKGTVEAKQALNRMFVIMNLENRGAALELMKTWEGTLSQLKTRWQLAAKDIYDAGFGESVKNTANSINQALSSNDFKRFSVEVGQGLASAVNAIVTVGSKIIEFADAIKTAAMAWLAYKVASGFVMPTLMELGAGYRKLMKDFADTEKQSSILRANRQKEFVEAAQASMRDADAAVAASRRKIQQLEAEMAAYRAYQAELNAQMAAARQAQTESFARRNGMIDPNTGDTVSVRKRMSDIAAEQQAASKAMQSLQSELGAARDAHVAAANAAAGHAAKVASIENGAQATSRGMRALTTAANAAGVAFNALGGWATVFNLALSAGLYIWATWESAAEKAAKSAERALRAQRGMSNIDDLKKSAEEAGEALKRREMAKRALDYATTMGWDKSPNANSRAEYNKLKTAYDQANADFERLTSEAVKHRKAIDDREAREWAEGNVRQVTEKVDAVYDGARREMLAINQATEAKVKAADGDAKKIEAAEKARGDQLKQLALNSAKARAAIIRDALNSTSENDDRGKATARLLREQLVDAQNDVRNAEEALKKFVFAQKNDGPKPHSPIVERINQLKAEAAELTTELAGMREGYNRAAKEAGALAKLQSEFDTGKFKFSTEKKGGEKDGDATKKQLDEAMDLTANIQRMRNQVADIKALQPALDDLALRYADAMELLADPLGQRKKGAEQRKVETAFKKLGEDGLRNAAQVMGTTADALRTKIADAMVIDMAPEFQKMEKESADLQKSLVKDTREGAKARKAAENEVHRQIMQNWIDELVAKEGLTERVVTMQRALERNTRARTDALNKEFRTPMEKLAADWQNTTDAMEAATARWAGSTIDAFVNMAKTGKFEWKGLVEQILLDLLRIQAQKAMGSALSNVMGNIGSWASAFLFADGGIMTSSGAVPLRAYAAGGVATSPQVAIYGEGSMNEAYVPLPDGRTIPVTMSGGQAPSVTVNVINQSGQQVAARQQGQPRFDGKQMVLDVVIEGINTPGPFRDNMRAAMGR